MELNLKDKVILVTGGSKGIGRDISLVLKKEGANVYSLARPSLELNKLEKEDIKILECNAKNEDELDKSLQKIFKTEGRLDVLINNLGGVSTYSDFENLNEEDWKQSFEINVLTAVRLVKKSLSLLIQSKSPKILNISSTVSVKPGFYNPHYSSMKAAINNLTIHLAKKYSDQNILVNALLLGPVLTDAFEENIRANWDKNRDFDKYRQEFIDLEKNKILLGKLGDPEEIGNMVAFLVSPRVTWLTGALISLDGGKSL